MGPPKKGTTDIPAAGDPGVTKTTAANAAVPHQPQSRCACGDPLPAGAVICEKCSTWASFNIANSKLRLMLRGAAA